MVRITTVPKMLSASDAFGEETSRRYPFVMVMKSTDFRQLPHRPYLPWLNDSRVGRVHRQRSMRTPGVIIAHVGAKQVLQMLRVEHDDIVQTLTTDTADDPLTVGILPWTAWRNLHFFDAHVLDALLKMLTVDRVAVSQQVPWGCIPGKRLDDLLGGPLCCWMFGDVDMHDAATLVRQHDEHEEHLACGGWDGEEITGHEVLDMVVQERFPCGRGRLTDLWPILLHCRFGNIDAKVRQLPDNARRAPSRIRLPHILDQLADLSRDGRSSRLATLTEPSPMVPESFLLPSNDRARLDEREHLLPAGPQPREPDPEETVGRPQHWARAALFIDRELMTQGDEFQLHGEP